MSALQWLGAGIIALPFIGLFAIGARDIGVGITVAIFAGVLVLAAVMMLGAFLVLGVIA